MLGYAKKHRDAKGQLEAWYHEADRALWTGPQDIKARYSSASFLHGNVVVFNIKGNKYRLVVKVSYGPKVVFVKWFGTHAEYDGEDF